MPSIEAEIAAIYERESRRVFATLIRLLGDFDRAEDGLQDAFASALRQWPVDGIPANPRAWLVSTGRFKAIDAIRRQTRFDASLPILAADLTDPVDDYSGLDDDGIGDDRLKLIFTCCNPALAPDARVALTLREICGLTTEEIARAYLISPTTLAQRIVRAKAKIRDANIPYRVPSPAELPERIDTVLQVVYLVYTEGYAASTGDTLTRPDLSNEAIRLGRLLHQLLPTSEVKGLLALMLLQESRRDARANPNGDIVLLEDQDRSRWDQTLVTQGRALVVAALQMPGYGPYAVQAAIAAIHADASSFAETDWAEMVALYDLLYGMHPTAIVQLNRAVAVAYRDGPDAGLRLIEPLAVEGPLADYAPAHSAIAGLALQLNRLDDAEGSYQRALELTLNEPERRFIATRLETIRTHSSRV